jgi:hypothetical protein
MYVIHNLADMWPSHGTREGIEIMDSMEKCNDQGAPPLHNVEQLDVLTDASGTILAAGFHFCVKKIGRSM